MRLDDKRRTGGAKDGRIEGQQERSDDLIEKSSKLTTLLALASLTPLIPVS